MHPPTPAKTITFFNNERMLKQLVSKAPLLTQLGTIFSRELLQL